MRPTLAAASGGALIMVAMLVARLPVGPLGVAPWLAALASLVLEAVEFVVGVTLRRRAGCAVASDDASGGHVGER
jgi:hypothetical protein